MADQRNGGIAWTEETWNPLRGCSRVSDGCRNCYAESIAARFCGAGQPYEGTINPETKRWNGTIKLVPEKLAEPLRWTRPRMVFVNSMSDLFHEDVPFEFIDKVFAVMALAKQHTFQVLTKRPERMREYFKSLSHKRGSKVCAWATDELGIGLEGILRIDKIPKGLPNVWLGVSVENQQAADERIHLLLQTPAEVHWVSVEPMIGPVDLFMVSDVDFTFNALSKKEGIAFRGIGLDWVVVGGESGPHARPMHPDWARNLRDQCRAAGLPFLFKQFGEFIEREPDYGYSLPWVSKETDRSRDRVIDESENGGDHTNCSVRHTGRYALMARVGKKAAGRMLDGVLHDGYPERIA